MLGGNLLAVDLVGEGDERELILLEAREQVAGLRLWQDLGDLLCSDVVFAVGDDLERLDEAVLGVLLPVLLPEEAAEGVEVDDDLLALGARVGVEEVVHLL